MEVTSTMHAMAPIDLIDNERYPIGDLSRSRRSG
jgi:hypothetical protein